jgi:hypothetical protein
MSIEASEGGGSMLLTTLPQPGQEAITTRVPLFGRPASHGEEPSQVSDCMDEHAYSLINKISFGFAQREHAWWPFMRAEQSHADARTHTHTHTHTHTQTLARIHTRSHAYTHACTHTHIPF